MTTFNNIKSLIKEYTTKKNALKNGISYSRQGSKKALLYKIRNEFLKWSIKGEFEKNDAYFNRLKTLAPDTLDNICKNSILNQYSIYFHNTPLYYNAEDELFTCKLCILKDGSYGHNQIIASIDVTEAISIDFAPIAKEVLSNNEILPCYVREWFVKDGYVFPRIFACYPENCCNDVYISLDKTVGEELKIYYEELNIEDSTLDNILEDYCYKFKSPYFEAQDRYSAPYF